MPALLPGRPRDLSVEVFDAHHSANMSTRTGVFPFIKSLNFDIKTNLAGELLKAAFLHFH